ncbi:MAG: hypothetical protein HZC46_09365 [Ignavibacterium album]|nr:hypothetical protein [Ignavibacterium album]MBI5662342.1 hypothetical protein [Ignavibacterium album]
MQYSEMKEIGRSERQQLPMLGDVCTVVVDRRETATFFLMMMLGLTESLL